MTNISAASPSKFKRFFESVSVQKDEGGYTILLDGRPAKTRGGSLLAASNETLADAVAKEWRGESETIEFGDLPLTRLLMTVIDYGESDRRVWVETIIKFLGSDLLCYTADKPQALVERQRKAWSPFLDWARDELQLSLVQTAGVQFVDQSCESIQQAIALLGEAPASELLPVRIITELTGSAVLGFAAWRQKFPAADIFAASRIDERFQREQWGEDAEAAAREARIRRDFDAACSFLELAGA